jgi:PAS domain S-box-containing protein
MPQKRDGMMEQAKALNVAIVGGGPGCKAIMDMIFAEKLRHLQLKLIGVASTNPEAVGYRYAQEKGIYTTDDYRNLYGLEGLNFIIELTGREAVAIEISATKPDHVRLMDHVAARLFWDVFRTEEKFIAERKRAEDALRESERKYSTLVENSLTGIYIDQGGKIVFANNRFAEIYGYAREELIGSEARQLVHPEDRALTNGIREKRLKGEEAPAEYEARGLTRDGKTIWITRRNTLIDYRGKPAILGNIANITEYKRAEEALKESIHRVQVAHEQSIIYAKHLKEEITEREQTEQALRESQERYYTVLEACPDPVVVYDMAGEGIYINPAFTRVFGWTPGEVLGMKISYVPDENRPETQMMIDKVLMGESFSAIESRRRTKEGKIVDVSISAAIYLDADGVPVGSVHILRDVTDRKRVEEALRKAHDELELRVEQRTAELAAATEQLKMQLTQRKRAEEALHVAHRALERKAAALEAANEELSEYAYIVSHDLKAPLRAIRNYTDFLYEDLEESLDGDQKAYLDGLKRAVRQGEILVEDMLEYSGVGRQSAPHETIDVGIFLQELVATLALPPDVEVVLGNEWPTIQTESTLLMQIFQDLIRNGVKFNHSPRKRVELGWRPVDGERYEFFVRDNGIGIEPRHQEQIFRMFHRLHTRKEYGGTGLGLAIVKKAAGKLHGSVRVESKYGEGCTFFIALPHAQKEK